MLPRIALLVLLIAGIASAQPGPLPAPQGRPLIRVNPQGDNSPENNNLNGESILLAGGRLYATWADYTGTANEDIFVSWSDDEGFSWSPMTRVDTGDAPGAASSDRPQIVLVDDGNPQRTLLAFWEENRAAAALGGGVRNLDLYYNRSTDGGTTWMPSALPINSDTVGNTLTDIDRINVGVDGSSVHVIWEEQIVCNQCYEVLRYSRSDDGGATWTMPRTVNTQITRATINPQITVNDVDEPKVTASNGTVSIVFADDRNDPFAVVNDLFALYSPDGGNSFIEVPVETNPAGSVGDLQVAREGSTLIATWIDTETIPGGSVRAAISSDGGLSWGSEINLSPVLETSFPNDRASQPDVDIEGQNIIVTWADSRGLNGSNRDIRQGYYSFSTDGGATWTTERDLDLTSGGFNQRPTIDIANGTAFFFFEVRGFGSNQPALAFSRDGGATITAPALSQIGFGGDVDSPDQHEGTFFIADGDRQKAWVILRDRPTGVNEVYVTGVSAPYMTLAGAQDTNGVIQVTSGSNTNLALRDARGADAGLPVFFGIGGSGSSPATRLPGGAVLHLVIDPLTLDLLNSPTFLPIVSGFVDASGDAATQSFVWPLPAGSPDVLNGAAVVIGPSGQVLYGTDPVTILTQ